MKVFSRLLMVMAALAVLACGGDDGAEVDTHSQGMKFTMPRAEPLPKEAAEPPDGDHDGPEEGAPDEVRETGFDPSPEAEDGPADECIDCVRETGFVPAPRLELIEVVGDLARLSWTVDDSVTRTRIDATRYGSDGHPVSSASFVVEDYDSFDLPLEGLRAITTATAVDDGGKVRSKQSDPVDIPAP